jgi:hypothetical protein
MPDGALDAACFDETIPRPMITETGRVMLWYREIIRRSEGDKLGEWKVYKIAVSTFLSVLDFKTRENFVLKIALEQGIGQYPKVLFAFEWFDARMQKSLRQEIHGGFVRG